MRYTDDDDEQAIMSTEANLRAAIMLVQGSRTRQWWGLGSAIREARRRIVSFFFFFFFVLFFF